MKEEYLTNVMRAINLSYSVQKKKLWNSFHEITYIYDGNAYTNYLGNYWCDYEGTDADGEGIGDTPYSIDSDKDNYPLMQPRQNYVQEENKNLLLACKGLSW